MSDSLTPTAVSASTRLAKDRNRLQNEIREELVQNILPYYTQYAVDKVNGGFYGRISNRNQAEINAPKGVVQHARLLWTYAHAYRHLEDGRYRQMAAHAYQFLLDHFFDENNGGFYWLVDVRGRPLQTEKFIYGQAFVIYGLSEYHLATGDPDSLEAAVALFHLLERRAWDSDYGGYFEVYTADWQRIHANVDQYPGPAAKTMNTHLHMLEAYTNLLRASQGTLVATSLHRLIRLHMDRIIDQAAGHLRLHLRADWQQLHDGYSPGHDIEASWLLWEAAELLGDVELMAQLRPVVLKMADVTLSKGVASDGGVLDEHGEKHWWAQAEALVGFFNAYQLTDETRYLTAVYNIWQYIQQWIVDKQDGEWIWGRDAQNSSIMPDKINLWKTPYHNSRACFELLNRLSTHIERSSST